jgi:large subunit ribosomal protein L15e
MLLVTGEIICGRRNLSPFPFFIMTIKLTKLSPLIYFLIEDMGAYKYLEEIWRKKQSDALRFLLRVR